MKKILIVLFSVLLLTGCNNQTQEIEPPSEVEVTDLERFKRDYTEGQNSIVVTINDNDMIKYSTSSEILSLLESGTGIIYFGRPTCPWCRNIVPVILEAGRINNMTVYYLNPGELSSDDMDAYVKVKEILDPYLEYGDDGTKTLYIPDVYFVKDGTIVGHHLGSAPSQEDAYVSLTTEQRQELLNIYQSYIDQLKD